MLDYPTPICFGNAGCPAMVRYGHGQWTDCTAAPELAGYRTVTEHVPPERRGMYRLFTCRAHRDLVTDPQPITDDDRAELEHRRDQVRLGLAEKPFERVQPIRKQP